MCNFISWWFTHVKNFCYCREVEEVKKTKQVEEEQPVEDGKEEKVKNGDEKAEENGDDDKDTEIADKTEGENLLFAVYMENKSSLDNFSVF